VALDAGGTSAMTASGAGTEIVRDMVRDAAAAATPLRVAGRSHWIDAGRPVDASRIVSLAAQDGVVDYVPGDLTITVRAGTTLGEIERVTGAEGQWLPLDPHGSKDGTIGATIATGSYGPLAHSFGRPRDLVLGVEFVTGNGKIVRGGGRVVKNVAGFDLVRLITGSWGTIGVITEATLRLYSLHANPVTLSLEVPHNPAALAQRITSILSAPGIPLAVELIDASMAERLVLRRKEQILVELGGNAAAVAAQKDALANMGGVTQIESRVWSDLRSVEDRAVPPIVVRISSLPARLAEVWTNAQSVLGGTIGTLMHATPGLGVVRCILPSDTPLAMVQRLVSATDGTTSVFERLPAAIWAALSPTVVADRISQGIKKTFDPSNILNPGIMGPLS
jgi:glycolate oxidase FAD binding subunit